MISYADFTADAMPPAQWPAIAPDDVALLQYTGGTTGLPKGAMLSHSNLTSAVAIYDVWDAAARAERNTVERVICVLPLFHIYALTVILLRSLSLGYLISLHQRFDVAAVFRDIEEKRATYFPGVPTMWIALANDPSLESRDLSSLAAAGSGGAPLPVEVAKLFERKTSLKLKSGWGMTETCSPGTGHPPQGPDKPGSIGLMLPGVEMDVVSLDDPSRALPAGEVGEIRIRGPNVTRGYWNRPKENRRVLRRRPFSSPATSAIWDGDGYFYLVDRKKDMIISGGFNVYPQMIEQAIYEHPAVQEVIVIGIPDTYRGEAAKAFIKLRAGAAPFDVEELRAFLTGKLGKHETARRARLRRRTAAHLGRKAVAARIAQPTTVPTPNNNNSQQEVAHDRSRYRLHRPHPDRQGLSRRAQCHRGRDVARPRHRARGEARRHRPEGGRGRGDGRGAAAGRHRRQHRAQGAAARRAAGVGRRHHHRPAMRLGPAGDRAGGPARCCSTASRSRSAAAASRSAWCRTTR